MTTITASDAYPLAWPAGWERTAYPEHARFQTSLAAARDGLMSELYRLGADNIVLSTNIKLRRDGLPYADRRQPDDRGVAVYFMLNGRQQCIPCDKWYLVEDNVQAIRKTIEALRGLERWGAKQMVDAAFQGFQALPANASVEATDSWWIVLGVPPTADKETIRHAYLELARKYHPDGQFGDEEMFKQVRRAFDEGYK